MTATPLRRALSLGVGWLADRKVPRALRTPLYGAYARHYGVDLSEVRLPLAEHPSFAAFFVRRLRDGARAFPADPRVLPSPCDGRLQGCETITDGSVLQAKGRAYPLRELLGGVGSEVALEGGSAWTIYLSPRDYHRVHAPVAGGLVEARWMPGARYSVAPDVLARRTKVLSVNERAVLRIESAAGPLLLVMVGALNVGRIRVVGVDPAHGGRIEPARKLERGDELARFELGSTVVLVAPPGTWRAPGDLALGAPLRMGQAIGRAG